MSTPPTPIRTAVKRAHFRLSATVLAWLDDLAREDAPGEAPNRAATVRRLIREERARRAEKGVGR